MGASVPPAEVGAAEAATAFVPRARSGEGAVLVLFAAHRGGTAPGPPPRNMTPQPASALE